MNDDHLFRVILIVGSSVLLPIAAYHRLKSQATGEKLDRRQEGLFIFFTLRPVGIVGMLGLIAYMVNPSWMAWSSVPLPAWVRWTGVGVGVIAGALLNPPQPREEPDGHSGHQERAHPGNKRPVSLGPPPLLCVARPVRRCQLARDRQLVHLCKRRAPLHPYRDPNAKGRRTLAYRIR